MSTRKMSTRKIAGSVPEKSVGDAIKSFPFSVISVEIFALGLNGHLATPFSQNLYRFSNAMYYSSFRIRMGSIVT